MAQYGKSEYWEDRYQKDKEPFDWYQRYSGIKDIITQYVQPSFSILNVGAGNSRKYTSQTFSSYESHTAFEVLWFETEVLLFCLSLAFVVSRLNVTRFANVFLFQVFLKKCSTMGSSRSTTSISLSLL